MTANLDQAVQGLPDRYPGPGGAVAVLRDGEVLVRHAWGWADTELRLPFTPETMALVCSITKQFTCALLLDQFADPAALDDDVRQALPNLRQPPPSTRELCHNQSGLRDYWALAMLCGAPVEGRFGPDDARRLIAGTRSLQFPPGTRYSYANQNFRLLSDIIERRSGQPFADQLRTRILDRAGMPHAVLNPDTSHVVGGGIGYEGSLQDGFRPAVNNIHWTGDAGMAASLDDMIAWERFIDASRDDADGLYNRLSAAQTFRDGAPASYGFGLSHAPLLGRAATCHGGGLRGWRSFRAHIAAERTSVVVLFNHMADPRAAALDLLAALFDAPAVPAMPVEDWHGRFLEPETGLATWIEPSRDAVQQLHFAAQPEPLTSTGTRLWQRDGEVWMDRPADHIRSRLARLADSRPAPVEGRFHAHELGADLTCVLAGGVSYGAFSGALGEGAMQPLVPFAPDIWLLPCPRALDYAAPGDWTLHFQRDASGHIANVRVGCWLARGIDFVRATGQGTATA